ncbi:hypothetical protein Golax_024281, partial [Gossypium laxum]|nr:hypothetical protein [Gossypium laxum]
RPLRNNGIGETPIHYQRAHLSPLSILESPIHLNKNTEWFTYPGVWTAYILIVFFSWLMVLSVLGTSPGIAWTIVHLTHFF